MVAADPRLPTWEPQPQLASLRPFPPRPHSCLIFTRPTHLVDFLIFTQVLLTLSADFLFSLSLFFPVLLHDYLIFTLATLPHFLIFTSCLIWLIFSFSPGPKPWIKSVTNGHIPSKLFISNIYYPPFSVVPILCKFTIPISPRLPACLLASQLIWMWT